MEKKILIYFVCTIMLFFSGCSSASSDPPSDSTDSSSHISDAVSESETQEETTTNENTVNNTINQEKITDVNISMEQRYGDTNLQIQLKGLKEYSSIEGDSYTDTPSEGKRYVVAYLYIENYMRDNLYFNAETISSTVDGQKLKHTFLVNDPEGYPSIFKYIPTDCSANGFIVWEVPENWQKIEFEYWGWEQIDHINIRCQISRDDLKDPVPFDQL